MTCACTRCGRSKPRPGPLCSRCYMADYRADPVKGPERRRRHLERVLERERARRQAGHPQLSRSAWAKLLRELDRLEREDRELAAPSDPGQYESNIAVVLQRQRERRARR